VLLLWRLRENLLRFVAVLHLDDYALPIQVFAGGKVVVAQNHIFSTWIVKMLIQVKCIEEECGTLETVEASEL
jgi:hypothetical protein